MAHTRCVSIAGVCVWGGSWQRDPQVCFGEHVRSLDVVSSVPGDHIHLNVQWCYPMSYVHFLGSPGFRSPKMFPHGSTLHFWCLFFMAQCSPPPLIYIPLSAHCGFVSLGMLVRACWGSVLAMRPHVVEGGISPGCHLVRLSMTRRPSFPMPFCAGVC